MQEENGPSVEEICDLNELEGQEIEQEVHIPEESVNMNSKNQEVMKYKDMSEAERQQIIHNNQDVEVRYVDRIVFSEKPLVLQMDR